MSFGRSKSRSDTDSTKAVSGTIRNMPIVPQQWFDMYGGAASSLGMGGNRTPFDPTPGGTFAPPPPGTTPQQGQVPNQPFGIDGQQFLLELTDNNFRNNRKHQQRQPLRPSLLYRQSQERILGACNLVGNENLV